MKLSVVSFSLLRVLCCVLLKKSVAFAVLQITPHTLYASVAMASKAKFYAVKKGKNPGIYTTWNDCNNQVRHPSMVVMGDCLLHFVCTFLVLGIHQKLLTVSWGFNVFEHFVGVRESGADLLLLVYFMWVQEMGCWVGLRVVL